VANHFCHLCGGLVDLIGLQPEGARLCGCRNRFGRQAAEIAALQEAVRWYHGYEVKGWPEFPVEMVVGKRYVFRSVARENSDTVRRALKEKP